MPVGVDVKVIKVDKLSFKNKIECHFFILNGMASVLNRLSYEF